MMGLRFWSWKSDEILMDYWSRPPRYGTSMLKVDQFRTNSHEVPKSSDCWVSISGSGSSASFLAEPKNWNGTLEPWNLLLGCKAWKNHRKNWLAGPHFPLPCLITMVSQVDSSKYSGLPTTGKYRTFTKSGNSGIICPVIFTMVVKTRNISGSNMVQSPLQFILHCGLGFPSPNLAGSVCLNQYFSISDKSSVLLLLFSVNPCKSKCLLPPN